MELWASGFNMWGQLGFEDKQLELPHDLRAFTCILKDETIRRIRTTMTSTLVQTSKGTRLAGRPHSITQLYMDHPDRFHKVAIAGNDRIAEEKGGMLHQFLNLSQYTLGASIDPTEVGELSHIEAGQTSFTAVSATGEVYTWGDERYESTLGREISSEHPAFKPSLVPDLSDLPTGPVRKISCGGYTSAALTAGNDLYLWGGRAGQPAMLEGLTGDPTPFDLDGEDVLDVAVGNDHIIALSVSGKIFVVGSCSNGQLGLADGTQLTEWAEVILPLKKDQRIVGVHAGYKNSFVLVDNIT